MLVVDASALVLAIADDGRTGQWVRGRLRDDDLVAPELVDLEVVSILRRHVAGGGMALDRAGLALTDLADLPLRGVGPRRLLTRCWELRATVTVYDASYLALAEVLGAPLLTADAHLARAPGVTCEVEVVA